MKIQITLDLPDDYVQNVYRYYAARSNTNARDVYKAIRAEIRGRIVRDEFDFDMSQTDAAVMEEDGTDERK